VEWLDPELEVGADEGLLRPPEPELLGELELEPELELPELAELPALPELPELDEFPVLPEDDDVPPEDVAELWVEPGRVRATAPATTTPATPTVAVVVLIRPRPRSRAAAAWATDFRFEVLMAVSFGHGFRNLLGTGSQQAMSLGPFGFLTVPFGVVTHG
jgi:hypothetical protein